MGRQIQLYVVNSDLDVLMNAVTRIEPVAVVAYNLKQPEPEELVNLRMRGADEEHWCVYLCRRPDIGLLKLRHVEARGVWHVDIFGSPVIEVDRTFLDGNLCKRGRLYYVTQYVQGDRWVEKPKAFIDWAERVFRATRSVFKRDRELGAYLGPEAMKLRAEGKVVFVPT